MSIISNWNPRKAKRDTAPGNLLTDAYRTWTGTDVALEPFAYMGDELPEVSGRIRDVAAIPQKTKAKGEAFPMGIMHR